MATLLAEATKAGAEECCGLLLGAKPEGGKVRITSTLPAANVADEPTQRFEINPLVLVRAHKAAREGSAQVLGYYHSHPNGRAEPSPCDSEQASGDGRIWAIIANGAISFWQDTYSGFEHLPYALSDGEGAFINRPLIQADYLLLMNQLAETELASLMCSRLCHDLLSPIGALTNGLELLAEEKDPEMRQRCFELLEQSAKASADKLRFFRLAFGAAGGFGEMVPVEEPRALIDALAGANSRITVNWGLAGDSLPKSAVKVMLNLAQIGMDALIRGGSLDIAAEFREGVSEIVVRASGQRVAFDPTVGEALEGTLPAAELSSRTAPAALLHRMVTAAGGGIQIHATSEALVMGAMMPLA